MYSFLVCFVAITWLTLPLCVLRTMLFSLCGLSLTYQFDGYWMLKMWHWNGSVTLCFEKDYFHSLKLLKWHLITFVPKTRMQMNQNRCVGNFSFIGVHIWWFIKILWHGFCCIIARRIKLVQSVCNLVFRVWSFNFEAWIDFY